MNSSSHRDTFREEQEEVSFPLEKLEPRWKHVEELTAYAPKFHFRIGQVPISLTQMEFRIIQYLSDRPYRACSPATIVQAIGTEQQPVSENELAEHIRNLRGKLGIFSDYIQSVPYIGYRFKP